MGEIYIHLQKPRHIVKSSTRTRNQLSELLTIILSTIKDDFRRIGHRQTCNKNYNLEEIEPNNTIYVDRPTVMRLPKSLGGQKQFYTSSVKAKSPAKRLVLSLIMLILSFVIAKPCMCCKIRCYESRFIYCTYTR